MRLDRILSELGLASRREAGELIRAGRVTVNGAAVTRPETNVDTASDFALDGEAFRYERFRYIMLNKPAGCLSATEDKSCPTALELLPPQLRRGLSPAGRLDKDAEGLLLLTNDGELAHKIISPKSGVTKLYYAECSGELGERDVEAFRLGIKLSDFTCLPAGLEIISSENGVSRVHVTVSEGKFHQVKRMIAARGAEVTYLKRLAIGGLRLDEALKAGDYAQISTEELVKIFQGSRFA